MLNKETFIDGMQTLLDFYPRWNIKLEEERVARRWYQHFRHMEDNRFTYMIDAHIKWSKFDPTIASLMECDTMPRKSRTQLEHEKMLKENGYA